MNLEERAENERNELELHNDSESEPERFDIAAELWDWTKSILLALAIVFIIHQFVFNLSKVEGSSMLPTLADGERLFVNKIIYLLKDPDYSDVVILKDPRNGIKQHLVKRVVAKPGDRVEIRDRILYVNGRQVEEPYTNIAFSGPDIGPMHIDEGHYYVLGDNRQDSLDSRSFGMIDGSLIKGRAEFIIWPLSKINKL